MKNKTNREMLVEIHTLLLGVNGQGGLLRNHEALKKDYYNFKRWTIAVFSFAVGSGSLGFGIFKLAEWIG